jgi:hypothetical protein
MIYTRNTFCENNSLKATNENINDSITQMLVLIKILPNRFFMKTYTNGERRALPVYEKIRNMMSITICKFLWMLHPK